MTPHCSDKDWLLLSRYLAGGLSPRQSAVLETRLVSEPDLHEALQQIIRTRALLSGIPEKKVPHNFTIKSGQFPRKQTPRFFPIFRIATVVSSLLFAVVVGLRMLPMTSANEVGLKMDMTIMSQESSAEDNAMPLAAPKAAPPVDEITTTTPDARTAAGAGVLTGAPSVQEAPNEEAFYEEEYIPPRELIPWKSITWGLGIISLVMAALAIYLYFQERV